MNPKSTNHTCKLYAIIREHGGWTNWIMEIIHFFKCNDQCEARTKEQEYFVLLNATLNSVEPMPTPKEPVKIIRKPKAPIKIVTNVIKTLKTYNCEICDFSCNKQSDLQRHLSTNKHKKLTTNNSFMPKHAEQHICNNCNKYYKHRQGLSIHKKKCNSMVASVIPNNQSNNFVIDKELVMLLIKENIELKTMMIDTQNQIIKHISKEKDPTFL
jgi:hypothetical protein